MADVPVAAGQAGLLPLGQLASVAFASARPALLVLPAIYKWFIERRVEVEL